MLTGWKVIEKYTGFCRNTILKLKAEDGFPMIYVCDKPTTLEKWVQEWLDKQKEKEAGTSAQSANGERG
jgi:hypothetical protein